MPSWSLAFPDTESVQLLQLPRQFLQDRFRRLQSFPLLRDDACGGAIGKVGVVEFAFCLRDLFLLFVDFFGKAFFFGGGVDLHDQHQAGFADDGDGRHCVGGNFGGVVECGEFAQGLQDGGKFADFG